MDLWYALFAEDEEMRDFSVTNNKWEIAYGLLGQFKQLTKSISYDSGNRERVHIQVTKNSANNIRGWELKRRGCMVTCKITMIAQFPGSGEYGPFNEVKIPVGYRPGYGFLCSLIVEVSGPNIFGTGRYGIGKRWGDQDLCGECRMDRTSTQRSRGITDD